ncbi:MAG: DUF11 domain-containing protein, partial [Anaerolineae bacterium]|nr:DUF11 domain-containing protein [Anaerolineae bacterium]
MKALTLIKQWLSSPAHRLVHVLLISILSLGVLWWAMHGQPVKADPSLIYVRTDGDDSACTGQFDADVTAAPDCAVQTIGQGVITVTNGGTVIVNAGLYEEIITITKPLTLTAGGLVTMTAVSGSNNTLITVVTDSVTIEGFTLIVNRPQAVAGIVAGIIKTGDTQEVDALTVRNCIIQDSGAGGVFDNDYSLPTNAVGIAVLSKNDGDAESVTLDNNLIEINTTGPTNNTTRGIWLSKVYGEVTDNELDGLAQDALIQFSFGGTTTISGNTFGGAGLDITEPNTDPIVITNNTFAPWTSSFAQSLLIKHNYTPGVTISVISNTFSGHTVGILSAASHNVTIHDNVFTPAPNASTFTHVRANTAYPTGGAQSLLGGANSITFTNNLFQRSTAAGLNGTAIEILNDNSKDIVDFDPITIGGTPSAVNTFDYGLARTVWLGTNVTYTNPAINAYWNNWGRTTVETIENTLYHQPDDANLAKIDFYSVTLAADPLTQRADGFSPIQTTATVTGFFTPGSGSIVSFNASSGTFSPALVATDSAGQAMAMLTSNTVGPTSIIATAGVAVNHPVSATTIVTFTPVADLTVSKSNGVDLVYPDDTLTYLITVTNTGFHTANNVAITDILPDYTTFAGASDSGTEIGGVVTWSTFSLDGNGASATRLLTVTVDTPLHGGVDTIINTVEVTDTLDINPDNNEAQDIDGVFAAPDLALTKSDGGVTVQPGDILIYTLYYTNTGNQDATGVVIAETVPAHTTFDSSASTLGWTCPDGAPAGTLCTYLVGDLAGEDFGNCTFAVRLVNPLPAGVTVIENTASTTDDGSSGADLDPTDNIDTITTPVDAAPDLIVSKDDNRTVVQPGETLS